MRLTLAEMDSPCPATISGGRSLFWNVQNSTSWLRFDAVAIRSSPYGLPVTTRKLPSYDPTLFRETDAEIDCPWPAVMSGTSARFWNEWNSTLWLSFSDSAIFRSPQGLYVVVRFW